MTQQEDMNPLGVTTSRYYGTENANGDSAHTFNERIGRCFELAAYALVFGSAPAEAQLIHGSMKGPHDSDKRIGHAWLRLPGGQVWEPIMHLVYQARAWELFAQPQVQYNYSRAEVRRMLFLHEHYGPWATLKYR